jgi:hypothetical protein
MLMINNSDLIVSFNTNISKDKFQYGKFIS